MTAAAVVAVAVAAAEFLLRFERFNLDTDGFFTLSGDMEANDASCAFLFDFVRCCIVGDFAGAGLQTSLDCLRSLDDVL